MSSQKKEMCPRFHEVPAALRLRVRKPRESEGGCSPPRFRRLASK
jgi:hypothetical protein